MKGRLIGGMAIIRVSDTSWLELEADAVSAVIYNHEIMITHQF